jgi:hypothetical protein
MFFHRLVVAVWLCLIVAGVQADVTNTRWQLSLIRGSTTVETVYAPTQSEVWTKCAGRIDALSETGNPTTVYICQTLRYYATAVSTCRPAPAVQTRPGACPPLTTGSWTQTSTSTVSAAPGCNVTTGPWLPATAPAGACVVTQSPPSDTATLSWTPSKTNTDGTALTNLAGYRISYGTSATALVQTVQVAVPGATAYTIGNLSPGTYFFAVRAYTSVGTESANSNVTSKIVR